MDTERFELTGDERIKVFEVYKKEHPNPEEDCDHDYEPTFQGGDTYKCSRCGKEIDITGDWP